MAEGAVTKIFGMFDKVDDIIYEPVRVFCDYLRQPIKQIELSNDKKQKEHEQKLKMELQQFEADLELDKKRKEMELTVEERRLNEEVNQMIMDSEMARNEKMIQLEVKYRKEMASTAVELQSIIANLQVETRRKILSLYTEKEKEYLDLQSKYKIEMLGMIKQMQEIFPNGSDNGMIAEETRSQLANIADRSAKFSAFINEDMKNVLKTVDKIVSDTTNITSKYLDAKQIEQPTLAQNAVNSIEQKY